MKGNRFHATADDETSFEMVSFSTAPPPPGEKAHGDVHYAQTTIATLPEGFLAGLRQEKVDEPITAQYRALPEVDVEAPAAGAFDGAVVPPVVAPARLSEPPRRAPVDVIDVDVIDVDVTDVDVTDVEAIAATHGRDDGAMQQSLRRPRGARQMLVTMIGVLAVSAFALFAWMTLVRHLAARF